MHHSWKRIFAFFTPYYREVGQKIRIDLGIPQNYLADLLFSLWYIPVGTFAFRADSWFTFFACDPLVFASFTGAFHDGYFLNTHSGFECILWYKKITLGILVLVKLYILPIIYTYGNILRVCQWGQQLPSAGEYSCR